MIPPFCCSRSTNSEVRLGWASRAPSAARARPSARGWRASWLLCASQGGEEGQGWRAVFSSVSLGYLHHPCFSASSGHCFSLGPCKFAPTTLMWRRCGLGGRCPARRLGAPASAEALSFVLSNPPCCGPGGPGLRGRWFPLERLCCDPKEAAV